MRSRTNASRECAHSHVRIHEGNYLRFRGAKLNFTKGNFFVEDGAWEEGYTILRIFEKIVVLEYRVNFRTGFEHYFECYVRSRIEKMLLEGRGR